MNIYNESVIERQNKKTIECKGAFSSLHGREGKRNKLPHGSDYCRFSTDFSEICVIFKTHKLKNLHPAQRLTGVDFFKFVKVL